MGSHYSPQTNTFWHEKQIIMYIAMVQATRCTFKYFVSFPTWYTFLFSLYIFLQFSSYNFKKKIVKIYKENKKVYQVGKETKYSQMMHSQPSIKMHLLSQLIYSCKTLCMFRTVFPSIIRSSKLLIQQRYMSNSCC